jgi:hypothetical protein
MNADLPDPEGIYEATESFVTRRVPELPDFSVRKGNRYPGSHPIVVAHRADDLFRLAPDDVIRRQQAEIIRMLQGRPLRADDEPVPAPEAVPMPLLDDAAGDLPGGLTWDRIEAKYRRLATESPGWRSRRQRADQPSRPEVAKALNVSLATLKRACDAAGKGRSWPPAGL